jgi:hypothetical protein
MPGFPFGPIRPNTRADLPLTERVLVPAVGRSSALRDWGAAAARAVGWKGIAPAMATAHARISRRVRSVGLSFIAACPGRPLRRLATNQFDAYPRLLRFACRCLEGLCRTAAPRVTGPGRSQRYLLRAAVRSAVARSAGESAPGHVVTKSVT